MYIIDHIKKLCLEALKKEFPNSKNIFNEKNIDITEATQEKFGHYQCNSAMKLSKQLNIPPKEIANKIKEYLIQNYKNKNQNSNEITKQDENKFAEHNKNENVISINKSNRKNEEKYIFEDIEIAGPGFLNITLKNSFICKLLKEQIQDPLLGVEKPKKQLKVVLDYSCPNIAKEMHVGHLRSTIIGDCLSRLVEFLGHKTLKLNHIGDWGTQFGMLINYLKIEHPELIEKKQLNLNLSDLMDAYKKSKEKFDKDPKFKKQSQQEVVLLQAKDKTSIFIWQQICEISRKAYQEIYDLLEVSLVDRGESFYNDLLPKVINKIEEKHLITVSNGAKCIYMEGFNNKEGNPLPLIVQKSDGGFNYATTDLAAIYHRVNVEKADWIIYVTDSGQSQHFAMVFKAAELASFYNHNKVRIDHVPLGLVLREDGKKFKTREGDTEKLIDLINKAILKAEEILKERNPEIKIDELNVSKKIIGINAIKYADLANHRTSNYKFSYEKMLQFEGNTAAFLTYAYVRIQSIKRKINKDLDNLIKTTNFSINTPEEISLALHLIRFADLIKSFSYDLMPHRLAEYLYKLAEKFHSFFHNCRVSGHCDEECRLLLCEAVSKVMLQGFKILGITPLSKM